ncbi:BTAD domain-containing putative transcriptional regulator [Parafrankia discariae]|uniref:BTAD domain-containing putative transcriptional regulator n=1 Tax=Parafrankia discariae TaxID=365528 RepID=UPI0003645D50|nr:BTAD domain-containing putative transcriptional regulator [Parafrankia discariae]
MLRIRLLGGVGVVTSGGEPVDVGPAKCQALLAALALAPGRVVPVGRLVELVWGPHPPRTAERTLQSYATRLRRALGPGSIRRVGAAYLLDVAPEAVDVVRFQRLLDERDVAAALAEWAGPPLAGLAAPGLAGAVDGLVERWLAAVEVDLAHRVESDARSALGRLTELTAAHPLREGLWALLMTALYRAGRPSEALAAFRAARTHLVETLGVEPGPALRELEALVLAHDERLLPHGGGIGRRAGGGFGQAGKGPGEAGEGLGEAVVRPGPDDRPGNLPRRLGRLLGREHDLEAVGGALAVAPVVTLVGPGGIGKTRLALAAAARHPDAGAVWLVKLTEIAASSDVARAVAGVVGVTESSGRPLGESVVAALRQRRVLLVLDNCEHVVDGAAVLAQAIAEGCPEVRIMATSREPLGLGHGFERLVAVGPLEPAGAGAELFAERARAVFPAFDARAGRAEITEICRRLDGLPLAIELAAARTAALGLTDLLERLDDQLRLLVGGARTADERHRTLRATVRWSYDLLVPGARRLFRQLSVFAGPFDLGAATAVAAGEAGEAEYLLGDLVARSMLVAEAGPFGRRFRLLETMRQFAAERLAEAGETRQATERHARWCLAAATRIQVLLAGPAEVEGVARLDELWPDLRAAFDRACAAGDVALARALVRRVVVEVVRRSRHEIGDWIERLLTLGRPEPDLTPGRPEPEPDPDLVVFALTWAAQRYKMSQDSAAYERLVARHGEPDHPLVHHARASVYEDYPAHLTWAAPAVAELRRRGEGDLAEQFELDVGAALLFTGRFAEHDAVVGTLVERYRRQGPPTLLNLTLVLLGYSALLRGRHDRADRLFDEAVGVEVPARTHSPNRAVQARAVFRRGERARAFAILHAHVEQLLDDGNMQAACVTTVEFVNMAAAVGRLEDAARMLGFLETTGLLEHPAWRTLVEGAAARVAADPRVDPERERAGGRRLDDRRALEYMRGVLGLLSQAPGPTGRPSDDKQGRCSTGIA